MQKKPTENERILRWDQRFNTEHYIFGTDPNEFLVSRLSDFQPGQKVLALADGEGRNGVWLARQGLDVWSLEASAHALKKAAFLAQREGVDLHFVQADVLEWEWPVAGFDVVVAIFIQFLMPAERKKVFALIRDTLKPGGLLLLQGYTPKQLQYGTGGPDNPEQLYTAEILKELLCDFEIAELTEHEQVLSEGAGHQGMSAVVDVVARVPRSAL